jgi:hypothetical protein
VLTSTGCEYYIGTSVGLYSTTSVSGTVSWSKEGSSTLAYALVSALDYRPEDNSLLIGTHGNGLYLAEIGNPAPVDIESSVSSVTMYLDGNEKKLFQTSSGVIAEIENLDNFDYGLTIVEIDNAGTGGMDFSTNTSGAQEITEKTIEITPTNTNSSGNVKITMYFSSNELSGWKTATGWGAKDMSLIKSPVNISTGTVGNSVEASAITLDSTYDGNKMKITGTFSNGFSGLAGGKGGAGGPLPVSFTNIELERSKDNNILVKWTTAQELNNDRFDVLRSIDSGPFENIGSVKGSGNSLELQHYSFLDEQISKIRYSNTCYHLNQVDYNSSSQKSDIVCQGVPKTKGRLEIYPNPVHDNLVIDMNNRIRKPSAIEIIDIFGQLVLKEDLTKERITLSMADYASGYYFVVLKQDNVIIETQRVFKY